MADDVRGRDGNAARRALFEYDEPVRFVYWQRFSGAYAAVVLVAAVAVVSFITGMSHLSEATLELGGPLAPYLPDGFAALQRVLGIVVGFTNAAVAVGLQRRNRLAWYGALVTLPLALVQGLASGQATDIPVVVLALAALPAVLANRSTFDRTFDLSPIQIALLLAFAGVQVYGTVGAYVLRDQYSQIDTLVDAFYYIVVTGTTVGYGNATPVTRDAKLFTISILVVGTAIFGAVLGSLIAPAIEEQMATALGNVAPPEVALLEDHIVVLGHSRLTEPLVAELSGEVDDVVVVTDDEEVAADRRDGPFEVLTGDPADEETLRAAGVAGASGAVVAGETDAEDAFVILTAKRINPDLRVVAAADDADNADKLENAGADSVITPELIGGYLLGQSVLDEADFTGFPDRLFVTDDGTDATEDTAS